MLDETDEYNSRVLDHKIEFEFWNLGWNIDWNID